MWGKSRHCSDEIAEEKFRQQILREKDAIGIVILIESIELKDMYCHTWMELQEDIRRLHWQYLVKLNLCLFYGNFFSWYILEKLDVTGDPLLQARK